MKLSFVRHLPTRYNKPINPNDPELFCGCTDVPIIEPISEDSKVIIDKFVTKHPFFDYYICSPLIRSAQTLSYLYPDVSPTIIEYIHENNYGELEGTPKKDIDPELRKMLQKGLYTPPGGESEQEVIARIEKFVEYCVKTYPSDANILIVSHAGFMRVLARKYGLEYSKEFLACITLDTSTI